MTRQELTQLIKDICGPVVAEAVGASVAAQVDKLQSAAAPSWAEKLVRGSLDGGPAQKRDIPLEDKGLDFARCVRATAAAKMSGRGVDYSMKVLEMWGYRELAAKWADAREKALAAGDATAGGFLVPTQFSQEVIEFLRARAVVRKLNARTLPVPNGTIKIPKLTNGATAYYVGENQNATTSQQATGQLTLSFKKLVTLVPMSNDLLRYASPGADTIVRDDVVAAMRVREDQAFIRDDGTASTPRGLRFWANPANILEANATVNVQNVFTDLGKMVQKLLEANMPMIQPGWIMAPRTEIFLKTLLNSLGLPVFLDEMSRGTLWGYPYGVTTSVPTNVGTSGTKSELYLVDFAQVIIGESVNLVVDASQEAAYNDGSGVVAAYAQDQTVVRAIAEHDLGVRHDLAIAVMTQLSWQPGSV